MFQGCELVDAGADQQQSAQPLTGAGHCHGEPSHPIKRPLQKRCHETEPAPGDEIAGRKEDSRDVWRATFAAAAVDECEQQDHGCGARQHHRHHHEPPHIEDYERVGRRPFHDHHAHVHAGTGDEIAPRNQANED